MHRFSTNFSIVRFVLSGLKSFTHHDTSPTGQRYINHQKTGDKILLFVREYKKENDFTSPYYFLGAATYVKHEGSRPMSITWKLEHPMPAFLWKETGKLAVG